MWEKVTVLDVAFTEGTGRRITCPDCGKPAIEVEWRKTEYKFLDASKVRMKCHDNHVWFVYPDR